MPRHAKRNLAAAVARGPRQRRDVLARFTLDYHREGAWWVGQLRELPAVISQGRTLAALEANIRDAYRQVLKATGPAARG